MFQNDRFFDAIKGAWWSIKDNLLQVHPTSMDELLHQPLVWNPLFLDAEGSMLGRRVRLKGSSGFIFCLIQQEYRGIRGGMVILAELRKLQLPLQDNIFSNCHKWVGLFSNFQVLLGVRGLRDDDTFLSYDVLLD